MNTTPDTVKSKHDDTTIERLAAENAALRLQIEQMKKQQKGADFSDMGDIYSFVKRNSIKGLLLCAFVFVMVWLYQVYFFNMYRSYHVHPMDIVVQAGYKNAETIKQMILMAFPILGLTAFGSSFLLSKKKENEKKKGRITNFGFTPKKRQDSRV